MKFCPNCGSKREDETICKCGFNYEKDLAEENINTNPIFFNGMDYINKIVSNKKEQNPGVISLKELKKRVIDLGDLIRVSYTSSGGMMGEYYNQELNFQKNEMEITNQDWHHGPKTRIFYKVDEKEVQEIKKILIENNFRAWSEIAIDTSMIAMDAPSSSMGLSFEKGYATINRNIYMSDEERKIYSDVRQKINNLVKEENIIKEDLLEPGMNMSDMMMQAKPIEEKIFCPECGSPIEKGETKCNTCGYIPDKK